VGCNVTRGAVHQLLLAIPNNAELRSVDLVESAAAPSGARIKKWHLMFGKDSMRLLQVDLSQPLSGKFQLVLSLVPRLIPEGDTIALRLPAIQEIGGRMLDSKRPGD